ncbi:tyrosine-type recombinase/integrase [Pedobacter jejuensis]|uniref:Tyr recombinase domain-containing protein n=1 Tax=Pedobacter jejuensis TaxID=1268550 RepID=A0A3N0C3A4_9SPHI|nr:site-specific integrase [Pedobacter jejuensis]RNL56437.1 hypothetical protein D7004_00685 [Pedobacter jejuensis]
MVKVKLREKELKSGLTSFYLDYYPPIVDPKTGKSTRREFLKMYIDKKTKDPLEKQKNLIIKSAAEKKKIDRENKFLTGAFESGSFFAQKESFLQYFKLECKNRASSEGNFNNWISAYKHFEKYVSGICLFKDLNERLCEGFKNYLSKTNTLSSMSRNLSANSQHIYFNKFKAAVRVAFDEGLLAKNHTTRIQSPKAAQPYREFLTQDEICRLKETVCENDTIKRAALFAIVCGMRVSDVFPLKWENYHYDLNDKHLLRFNSKKPGEFVVHPISAQGFEFMGSIGSPKDRVFKGLKYSANTNKLLERWMHLADIKKKITWHNFRHTYAVNVIEKYGIYAGKEMLHHKHVKTTEIYSKMRIQHKIEIANSIEI